MTKQQFLKLAETEQDEVMKEIFSITAKTLETYDEEEEGGEDE